MGSTNSVDRICAVFIKYCETEELTNLSTLDVGYIQHSMDKANLRGTHQLFCLLALFGDPQKVEPFLLAVAKKYLKSVA